MREAYRDGLVDVVDSLVAVSERPRPVGDAGNARTCTQARERYESAQLHAYNLHYSPSLSLINSQGIECPSFSGLIVGPEGAEARCTR